MIDGPLRDRRPQVHRAEHPELDHGGLADVARPVDRPDRDRVLLALAGLRLRGDVVGGGAGLVLGLVEPAPIGRARLRRERDLDLGLPLPRLDLALGPLRDRRVRRGRVGRRRRIDDEDAVGGIRSGLPAASVARTLKRWPPLESVPVVWERPGPEHGANGSSSTLQAKVELGSDEAEGEGRRRVGGRDVVGRAGVDRGVGWVGVDGEGAGGGVRGRRCRPRRWPDPEGVWPSERGCGRV